MKKIYTVTAQSRYDYNFSVVTTKHGAFTSYEAAVKKLKIVVEDVKTELCKRLGKNYKTVEVYDSSSHGYWVCSFGFEEDHECHQVCVDEFEIEE